jgi:hypothetical protein
MGISDMISTKLPPRGDGPYVGVAGIEKSDE